MIDRKLETDIRSFKSFLEFWGKFHAIYEETATKEVITKEDEAKYLETKVLMGDKYAALIEGLDFTYVPRGRFTDPVRDILAVESVRLISEPNLKKLHDDWKDSYVFLNNVVERLKERRRRLGRFSPVGVFFKRLFERRT